MLSFKLNVCAKLIFLENNIECNCRASNKRKSLPYIAPIVMSGENTAQSFLPIARAEEVGRRGCTILETSQIANVHRKLKSPIQSPGKKELKSDVYKTRDNKRIKIEDEIQVGSPFHITRDEYPTENMPYVNSELMSVKPEEEIDKHNPTDALLKVKHDIGDCTDIAIVRSESEPYFDSFQNGNNISEASFKCNANNQLVKIEPELQIEPYFENNQQEQEFKDQYLPLSIKESNFCDESQKANSNYSSSDINDDDKIKKFDPLDHIGFVCPECGECCETRQARLWHLSEQHTELTNPNPFPKFKCKLCGIMGVIMIRLTEHIRFAHGGEKLYNCTPCGLAFANKQSRNDHMRRHTKLFPCDYCKETFITRRERQTHLKSHLYEELNTEDCNFSCPTGSSKFRKKNYLSEHIL